MAGKKQNKRMMLQPAELVRDMTCIIWADSLKKIYGDKDDEWYWKLIGCLNGLHTECVVSPIHRHDYYDEQDVQRWHERLDNVDKFGKVLPGRVPPSVGDPKAEHVHILVSHSGNKTPEQVTQLIEWLWKKDGVLQDDRPTAYRWQRVLRRDSLIRYFAHLDEPESGPLAKYHYPSEQIISLGGADLSCLQKKDEIYNTQLSMFIFSEIRKNKLRYYCDLVDWAIGMGDFEIYSIVYGRSSTFSLYLRSQIDKDMARKEAEKAAQNQAESAQANT